MRSSLKTPVDNDSHLFVKRPPVALFPPLITARNSDGPAGTSANLQAHAQSTAWNESINWDQEGCSPHGSVSFQPPVLSIQHISHDYLENTMGFMLDKLASNASHPEIAVGSGSYLQSDVMVSS